MIHIPPRMRKGTHSCLECRRRKIRCIPRPEDPSTCSECFSRGTRCREQKQGEPYPAPVEDRPPPNLRERVARLEHAVKSMHSMLTRNGAEAGNTAPERDAAEALNSLQSDTTLNGHTSSDPSSIYSNYNENAPLLSMFDNAVLSKEIQPAQRRHPQDTCHETLLDASGPGDKAKAKHDRVRHVLLNLLPAEHDLHAILESTTAWWDSWRLLFPEISVSKEEKTLKNHILGALKEESPVSIARGLICLGICFRQTRPGADNSSLYFSRSPKDTLVYYLSVVDQHIIADDEYAGSCDGLELIVLVAKTHVNLGHPRKGWLLLRRGVAIAQLMGLHPDRTLMVEKPDASTERRENAWWSLYMVDRYISLLLGLPYALSDGPVVKEAVEKCIDPTGRYQRKIAMIVGDIIDRNQVSSGPSLPLTLEIDQNLENVARIMSDDWWDIESARSSQTIPVEESFCRKGTQLWHFQTKAFLHLPFMLQSATDRRYEYNRHACLDAARQMLHRYHLFRLDDKGPYFICKIMDFQVFNAVVLLLLGLLGYGSTSAPRDAEDGDLKLIETTLSILRGASNAEPDDAMLSQAVEAIETLAAFRSENAAGDERRSGKNCRIVIPYFGTINISPGSRFLASKIRNGSLDNPSHGNPILVGGLQPTPPSDVSSVMPTLDFDPNAPFEFPHIDIDWSSIVNMDLDQNWDWNQLGI